MPRININLYNTKNELRDIKGYLNEYKNDLNSMFVNLNKVDTAWNDDNEVAFINRIKKDQISFLEHILSMANYVNVLTEFISMLENAIYNEFGIRNARSIIFDSSLMDSIIRSIDNIIDYLDDCNNIIAYMAIPDDFSYKENLIRMENYFTSPENQFIDFKNKLNRINRTLSNAYYSARDNINRVNYVEIDGKTLEYNYRIFNSLEGKKVKFENVNKYSNQNNNKIDVNINSNTISSTINNNLGDNTIHNRIDSNKLDNQNKVASAITDFEHEIDDVIAQASSQNRNISNASVNYDIDSKTLNASLGNKYNNSTINHDIESNQVSSSKINAYNNNNLINYNLESKDDVISKVNNSNVDMHNSEIESTKIEGNSDNKINTNMNNSEITSEKIAYSDNNSINVNVGTSGISANKIDTNFDSNKINTNINNSTLEASKSNYDDIVNLINTNVN